MHNDKTVNGITDAPASGKSVSVVVICAAVAIAVIIMVGMTAHNNQEASPKMYEVVSAWYDYVPELQPLIRTAMKDGVLSLGEYKDISKAEDDIELLAWRTKLIGKIQKT